MMSSAGRYVGHTVRAANLQNPCELNLLRQAHLASCSHHGPLEGHLGAWRRIGLALHRAVAPPTLETLPRTDRELSALPKPAMVRDIFSESAGRGDPPKHGMQQL